MSFSTEVKEYLAELRERHECCIKSMLYGMYAGCGAVMEDGSIVLGLATEKCASATAELINRLFPIQSAAISSRVLISGAMDVDCFSGELGIGDSFNYTICCCEKCPELFVRGVFIACGRITDPSRDYHLELLPVGSFLEPLEALLSDIGLPAKRVKRRKKTALYYKSSASVEDFLTYIGAGKYALELMEEKVIKDMRNKANRKSNCEFANMDRSATAAASQLEAIKKLAAAGELKNLPPKLHETAMLRLEFEELSLDELRMRFNPPVSKSGLSHRLNKLVSLASKKNES